MIIDRIIVANIYLKLYSFNVKINIQTNKSNVLRFYLCKLKRIIFLTEWKISLIKIFAFNWTSDIECIQTIIYKRIIFYREILYQIIKKFIATLK